VVVLVVWSVIDVIDASLAVGHYEHRITVATHGDADVWPAWLVYEVLDSVLPHGMAITTADRSRILGSLVAAAAFVAWLYRARRNATRLGGSLKWAPGWAVGAWLIPVGNLVIPYLVVQDLRRAGGPARQPAPVGWWWASVLVAVLLNGLVRLYDVATTGDGVFKETALDTRAVAYPLWTAGTVAVVVTALLSVCVVRRITEEQRRIGEAAATGPA
jgi:hypothetical protein